MDTKVLPDHTFVVPVYGLSDQERDHLFDEIRKQLLTLFASTNCFSRIYIDTVFEDDMATAIVITGLELFGEKHADFLANYLSVQLQHRVWTRNENLDVLLHQTTPLTKWAKTAIHPSVYVRQPYANFISATFAPEATMASAIRTCYSKADPKLMFDKFVAEMNVSPQQTLERITELYTGCMESGHHSVFEHFNVTFAVGGSRACYSWDTEVYTKRGWRLFSLLLPDDEFLTRRNDGTVYFQKPNSIIRYPYVGKMHWYKGSGNIDLLITPDHRVLAKKYDVRSQPNFELIPSEDLKSVNRWYMTKKMNVNHFVSESFTIPPQPYRIAGKLDSSVKMTDAIHLPRATFYRFLAWYLGEGSCQYSWQDNSYRITITQVDSPSNAKNRAEICDCIRSLGCTPNMTENGITFKSLAIGIYLIGLGVSHEKYIPLDLFTDFNSEYASLFLDTYVRGDGSTDNEGHRKLYTTSWKLADQLQMLAFITGSSANIWEDNRVGQVHIGPKGVPITHNHICYVVSLSKGVRNVEPVVKMDRHMQEIDYSHMVYCAELQDDHVMFVRRNGIPIWSGNCSHQLVRHRIASFCLAPETVISSFTTHKSRSTKKRTIEELYRLQETHPAAFCKIIARSVNNDGVLCSNGIRRVVQSGIKPLYRVTTKSGRQLISTLEHRYLIKGDEYKQLKDLSIGDRICANGAEALDNESWLREMYLVENHTRAFIAKIIGCCESLVWRAFKKFGIVKNHSDYPNRQPGGLYRPLTELEKQRISQRMLGKNNHQWKQDSNDLTNSGGHVRAISTFPARMCWGCAANDVSILERHHLDKNPKNNTPENVLILCQRCHNAFHHIFAKTVFYDEIVSIEYDRDDMTYDIEMMRSPYNFVANGLVVHNSQQSQRYIEADAYPVVLPPTLRTPVRVIQYLMFMETQILEYKDMLAAGVEKEDARFVFGNGAFTQLTITMNVRSLMNFFAHRCCHCAQWEIRRIATELLSILKREFPVIFNHEYMGAKCHRLGYCEEKPERSCRKYPLRADMLFAYDELRELKKKYDQLLSM